MTMPRNPVLYNALLRRFPRVKITDEGAVHIPGRGPIVRGRLTTTAVVSGEYYQVTCPYCNDTKLHLWINHMFGVQDDETKDDRLYLAHCFLNECINSRARQRDLYERIFPFNYGRRTRDDELVEVATPVSTGTPASLVPVAMPAPLFSLHAPQAVSARQYLVDRGFNIEELATAWDVSYCVSSAIPRPAIYDRIVVPIYTVTTSFGTNAQTEPRIAGWQARAVHALREGEPKYLTFKGMKKSELLYGLPQAKRTVGPIVVVEGVTDAWRLGTNAIAVFGKTISKPQQNLLVSHFVGRPIVIMFDEDAHANGSYFQPFLSSARRQWGDVAPVVTGRLPDGRNDIGECSRQEAWEAIWNALTTRRVSLS